jgi:hypothetical protein
MTKFLTYAAWERLERRLERLEESLLHASYSAPLRPAEEEVAWVKSLPKKQGGRKAGPGPGDEFCLATRRVFQAYVESGDTQRRFAEAVGIEYRRFMNLFRRPSSTPRPDELRRICEVYEVDPRWLLGIGEEAAK